MPPWHACTPEEDHIGRNVVYIKSFCPMTSAASSDYNFLLYTAYQDTLLKGCLGLRDSQDNPSTAGVIQAYRHTYFATGLP